MKYGIFVNKYKNCEYTGLFHITLYYILDHFISIMYREIVEKRNIKAIKIAGTNISLIYDTFMKCGYMNSNKRCGFYRTVVGKTFYTSKIFFSIIFSILIIGEKNMIVLQKNKQTK